MIEREKNNTWEITAIKGKKILNCLINCVEELQNVSLTK